MRNKCFFITADLKTAAVFLLARAYGCTVDVDPGLRYHEDRTPTQGCELTREATMAAFARSWRGE